MTLRKDFRKKVIVNVSFNEIENLENVQERRCDRKTRKEVQRTLQSKK